MRLKLFVGGLSWSTQEEGLTGWFESGGCHVIESMIMRERDTGKHRGFGFVTVDTSEVPEELIERFHEQELDGRKVTVNHAAPKKDYRTES